MAAQPQPSARSSTSNAKIQLWLFPYLSADAGTEQILAFADAVRRFAEEISGPCKLYHEELPLIHSVIKKLLPVHRTKIACLLGTLKNELDLEDLLCGEIAKALFITVVMKVDTNLVEESRAVLRVGYRTKMRWWGEGDGII